ncbi:phage tail sheath family protein [Sphingomonas bacterium]|uniref:phage tail sheath family protein n=1 Tax=Sphingomonas bacterium TaxID=1895847 RepID=UPI00261977D3|nr:phage tail sheath family protein [Sphingomonas bacterium]MDB5678520.1 phage tail sheath family protein [Sphingomonas bacterium]
MAEYLAPGVFIEEIERGPRPIEGVSTSTAAFLGETERGQTWPRLVTNFNDYRRYFGTSFADGKFMPDAVSGFFENGGQRAYICRIVGAGATPATVDLGGLTITAKGPGDAGNRIFAKVVDSSTTRSTGPVGFRLQVAYFQTPLTSGTYPDPFDPTSPHFPAPTVREDFDDLVWDDPTSPDYFVKRLETASALVAVTAAVALAAQPTGAFTQLAGGTDAPAAPGLPEFKGENADTSLRTGLSALELDEFRDVALVYAPAADDTVAKEVYEHCERSKFRFAVIDPHKSSADVSLITPRDNWDTEYAAFYYPWIGVADLRSGQKKMVPPGGHVLGLYARTDVTRGVWKAPANDTLSGVFDLEYLVNDQMQQMLNPNGVNAIRKFPGRGIRVWGARTLSSNSLWKYVSVRRLFIFLERSIYEGTQWVVFEPNDERLWERVKDTIRLFLRTQWRNGALMGVTEDQAFTIACDRSTMTQDDILNGRLICEIGIAPVRPAEFVVFRIFQNTAEAQS